jgi:outer membrane protein TolC
MVGPKYVKPNTPLVPEFEEQPPESFNESDGWKPALPGDQGLRGKWWEIFGDSQLNALEEELTISNQDLKVAEARLRQARATIRFNRSQEFPTISTSPSIVNERDSANQRNDIDIARRRMDASVLLVKAVGGGWDVSQLPSL